MMSGLSTKQLQPADVDPLELSDDRERQKSSRSVAPVNTSTQVYETGFRDITSSFFVRSHRSKRNRRGPVIEADGMLKMFHCPYEGCSQVYVAISSFQVGTPCFSTHSVFILLNNVQTSVICSCRITST